MGLVHELSELAARSDERVSSLVRLALVVAVRLDRGAEAALLKQELNGYESRDGLPWYREIKAGLIVTTPKGRMQVPPGMMESEYEDALRRLPVLDSVPRLESLIDNQAVDGFVQMEIPTSIVKRVVPDSVRMPILMQWSVAVSLYVEVLNHVRDAVLEWSLELEKLGVVGEGMTFKKEEQERARAALSIKEINAPNAQFVVAGTISQNTSGQNATSAVLTTPSVATSGSVLSQRDFEADIAELIRLMSTRLDLLEKANLGAIADLKALQVEGREVQAVAEMVEDLWVKQTGESFKTFAQRLTNDLGAGVTRSFIASGLWKILGLIPHFPL